MASFLEEISCAKLKNRSKSQQETFAEYYGKVQRWDYYGRPTSFFLRRVCPPNRPKCPKMGVRTRVRTHFFRYVAGSYTRERMVRSTHRRGAAPKENFHTKSVPSHLILRTKNRLPGAALPASPSTFLRTTQWYKCPSVPHLPTASNQDPPFLDRFWHYHTRRSRP